MEEKELIPNYKYHLESSDDLVTSYEQTRAGFIALALEKNVLVAAMSRRTIAARKPVSPVCSAVSRKTPTGSARSMF